MLNASTTMQFKLGGNLITQVLGYNMQNPHARRDHVQNLNEAEISRLMHKHRMTIRAIDIANWRPTARRVGAIPGVWQAVTIIATNGILGWFELPDGPLQIGHIQCFEGKIEPLYSSAQMGKTYKGGESAKPKKPRVDPTKLTHKELRAKMLDDL